MSNYSISTYIINLPERTERLSHILQQFEHREEFDVHVIEACRNAIGAVGLWNSLVKIITHASGRDEDVIIVCEDDHQFTRHYSKALLFQQIEEAYVQRCDILCGGISGGFKYALPLTQTRFWVDGYYCNQFVILFKSFFNTILEHSFNSATKVDITLTSLTANKMVIHPFISTQKPFGYSDVTPHNNENPDWVRNRFDEASLQLDLIKRIFYTYYY